MNRQVTQFWVAVISIGFLGLISLAAVIGYAFGETPGEHVTLFAGGLIGIAGQASAYLFRLNGYPSKEGPTSGTAQPPPGG